MGAKSAYRDILSVEQTGPRSFRFHLRDGPIRTRRLVMQTASFMPLAKHYWKDKDFSETTIVPPLGNGAYRVKEVDLGHKIVFEPWSCWSWSGCRTPKNG